jgi:hypothetical protein
MAKAHQTKNIAAYSKKLLLNLSLLNGTGII